MMITFIPVCNYLKLKPALNLPHFNKSIIERINTLAVMVIDYLTKLALMIADHVPYL